MLDLDLVILGALTGLPMHGYKLKRTIESIFGKGYFSLSNSHLYPRLARLEAEGHILGHIESQENRPARKVYELTQSGMKRLKQLIASPIDPHDNEMEILSRIFFFGLITAEERRSVIEPLLNRKLVELDKGKLRVREIEPFLDRYSRAATYHVIERLEREVALYRFLMED